MSRCLYFLSVGLKCMAPMLVISYVLLFSFAGRRVLRGGLVCPDVLSFCRFGRWPCKLYQVPRGWGGGSTVFFFGVAPQVASGRTMNDGLAPDSRIRNFHLTGSSAPLYFYFAGAGQLKCPLHQGLAIKPLAPPVFQRAITVPSFLLLALLSHCPPPPSPPPKPWPTPNDKKRKVVSSNSSNTWFNNPTV